MLEYIVMGIKGKESPISEIRSTKDFLIDTCHRVGYSAREYFAPLTYVYRALKSLKPKA